MLLATLVLMALPSLVDLQPNRIDLQAMLMPPSRDHLLGTDENGRDVLSRILVGARLTIGIGLAGAALAVVIGVALGGVSGFLGGIVDALLMRLVDFAMAVPTLFVILVFASLVSPGPLSLVLLIGGTGWMPVARLVRGQVKSLLSEAYLEAALLSGATVGRQLVRHVLPNTGHVIAVAALIQMSRAILTEATISFLGQGIQPPTATWGNMLIGAQDFLFVAPWLTLSPGVAITLTLLAIASLPERDSAGRTSWLRIS